MSLPEASRIQFTPDLSICRLLNGMWQVSGAHGFIDREAAVGSMFNYLDSGFTTWDLADHYGPAEDFVGEFRRNIIEQRGAEITSGLQAFTKWVPRPGRMTRQIVEESVNVSLKRMDVEAIDLLQFHWWDYEDSNYLEALAHLSRLRDEGKIKHLGVTNFDTAHLKRIVDHGIRVVSNQVQFSIIDRRPEVGMTEFCEKNDIKLLSYGTICGGMLSEEYLGRPEPRRGELNTASLGKYKGMIDAWGDWNLFQELLGVIGQIALKHGVSIANVATRYVLERRAVAGVIIGARLGVSDHREDNARVFAFALEAEDYEWIDAVLESSNDLYRLIGDCGDEYRR